MNARFRTELIEDYLLWWILLAVGVGLIVPSVAVVTRASTAILAVMIGSISLTLSVDQFSRVTPRAVGIVLLGHVTMPFFAYAIAHILGLSSVLTVGFVVLGAVTPELVTPVMTELAGGETALATTALVVIGIASVGFTPAVVSLFVGSLAVPTMPIVNELVVAVVVPMLLAVGLRAWQPDRVGRYDPYYPALSAIMVMLIIGGVTAANAESILSNGSIVAGVGVGVLLLNVVGYTVGYVLGVRQPRPIRIASIFSIGMRDFAIAAALVLAAGLPTMTALPAVVFGVIEMTTSAGLAAWFRQTN